jgi:hypothetical protein
LSSPPQPTLAVAASAAYPNLLPDWPVLQDALRQLGITASTQVWTDPDVRWAEFDLVLANGAWDNIHRPEEFLGWVDAVATQTRLVNPPDILRWSLDKRYLAALAAAGVPTVPTTWLEPDQRDLDSALDAALDSDRPTDGSPGEIVVKPAISGGGFETARYHPGETAPARAHILRLLDAGRTVMVQPYQAAVDTQGEGGLIFLGGRFSHAIAKSPLLRPGAGPQSHLWQNEEIGSLEPTGAQLAVAAAALTTAENLLGPTTYARVDLVPAADGTPAVLELELLDPALFFGTRPSAAIRFAQVLQQRMA